jgi:hypothetical protein
MADNDPDLVTLVQELAASGDDPIVAPDGTTRTLRGALKDVFGKVRTVFRLDGRPVDPRKGDDLTGHVLSMRAEMQILRALLTDLARRQGVPVDDLVRQTLQALQ